MKKNLYSVIFTIFAIAFASNYLTAQVKNSRISLHQTVSTEAGVSKHFVTLNKNQQVKFNPAAARRLFGLDPNSDLVLQNSDTDGIGFIHYRYYQIYKGLPVENTMYIVHTKGGIITGATGSIITKFYMKQTRDSTKPIGPDRAIGIALKYIPAKKYAWEEPEMEYRIKLRKNNQKATYYPVAKKTWFCPDDTLNAFNLRLCYKIDVYSLEPLDRKFTFVEVSTGRVLGTKQQMESVDAIGSAATAYSGIRIIHSDQVGTIYNLRDMTRGKGIITLNAVDHTDFTSSSPNWNLATPDQYALDVHFGIAATWDFYQQKFHRNSIDNKGYTLVSWVNDPGLPNSAKWDGSEMIFGNQEITGQGMTTIDIAGHEMTHGLTQYTSCLAYSKESGAINESISDIMGKSVQFITKPSDINWEIANDMNQPLRSLSDPNSYGLPDTYRGNNWIATESCGPDANDFCGVHTNSSVGNFMFYLLVNGGTGKNDDLNTYWVSGIGLEKAVQIIYRTETVYLTPTSQYKDWWIACKNAAADLFGPNSNELAQVENAWYAVGFGDPPYFQLAYLIAKPVVSKAVTVYDGQDGRPEIRFREGDSVILVAGGCVRTGGEGKTWKRFVNPSGPNADRLYFCNVEVPGVTAGLVPMRLLDGNMDLTKPDIRTVFFTTKVPSGIPESQRYFVLGYVDDVYHDNGYEDHDNGTEDQCKSCGNAFMSVIIWRKVTPLMKNHP